MSDEEDIKKLQQEVELVKDVLGNLIAWLPRELGLRSQKHLIDRLGVLSKPEE